MLRDISPATSGDQPHHSGAAFDNAEFGGYLSAVQAPDGMIHLVSSRLHYRFNLTWLQQPQPGPETGIYPSPATDVQRSPARLLSAAARHCCL
jgi:hypothetical protein